MAATSRDELQRQADGYVRQGRLDAAIGAYEQLVQLPTADWNLIKQLADLQERAGHREAAAVRFVQCADHYFEEGFLARAAALYRKVLKLDVKSEHALGKLADVSLELKLTGDARQALTQLVTLRRARGDEPGALAAIARLSTLEGVTVRMPASAVPAGRLEVDATPALPPVLAPIPDPEPVTLPEPEPTPLPEPDAAPDPEPEFELEPRPELEPGSEPEPCAMSWTGAEPVVAADVADPFVPAPELWEEPIPTAPAHGFDWGALLGRDVAPVADAPASDLFAEPFAVAPEPSPGTAAPVASESWEARQTFEIEETDLTELLDQLAGDRPPSFPKVALVRGDTPADADHGVPDADPEWPLLPEASSPTPEDMATAVANVEASVDEGDARTMAAQQLAAGRVFAAAGLVAEAARSFERASRDVRTRFEAAEALGSLHRSRGQLPEAVRWYDEAAQAPVADEAVRRPVLYDLAEALEAVGQPGRALAVLLDLLSEVEDYRDARARADRLFRVDAGG